LLRATLAYCVSVYVVWACYYTITELASRNFGAGVFMEALVTTIASMFFFGVPTIAGAIIVVVLRRRLSVAWFLVLSVLVAFGPSLYLSSRLSDHKGFLIQQIAQTLFLAYFALRFMRRPA